ncbi:MAG: 16S rRNA (adenine(1518)-N(6)/adenine(1519)-N(6))-dimethyltransferase RsmA [Holosporales bacterium]|jgi:16S rRNA (adenine1518-N6/adenine1519-N6)-dimethyltransferase|nr:16S rRNA (adenine(1518)-N(6)/adenine(1519)-N(6))-dimethyltransferase RsmA [Holosporales bacterium]
MKNDLNLTIRQIINKYDLLKNRRFSKSLGQHFLCDYSLLLKIAMCASPFGGDEDIVEIGPGPGGLTRALMECATSRIFCIEKDTSMKEIHDNLLKCYKDDRLHFIYGDALNVNLCNLTDRKIVIVSNLPYNIGTPLLLKWMRNMQRIDRMVLMFQKEVADRIVSKPDSKSYGRLSVVSQNLCKVEKMFDVSNKAFYPSPKVISTVLRLTPKQNIDFEVEKLEKLTAICFGQRRKTIFSSMKRHFSQEILETAFKNCEIEKTDRPETILPANFINLLNELQEFL